MSVIVLKIVLVSFFFLALLQQAEVVGNQDSKENVAKEWQGTIYYQNNNNGLPVCTHNCVINNGNVDFEYNELDSKGFKEKMIEKVVESFGKVMEALLNQMGQIVKANYSGVGHKESKEEIVQRLFKSFNSHTKLKKELISPDSMLNMSGSAGICNAPLFPAFWLISNYYLGETPIENYDNTCRREGPQKNAAYSNKIMDYKA